MCLKIILFVSLLSLSFCSKQKRIGKEIFEGYIYDSIRGNPASGEAVHIDACVPRDGRNFCTTFSFGSAVTDSEGYFKIEGKPVRSRRYYISARGNNMKEPSQISGYSQKDIKLYIYKSH